MAGLFDDILARPKGAGLFDDILARAPIPQPTEMSAPVRPDFGMTAEPPLVVGGQPGAGGLVALPPPSMPAMGMPGEPPLAPDAPPPLSGLFDDILSQPSVTAAPAVDPFANEPLSDLFARRGQQFARGATEVIASQPEALAISAAILEGNVEERLAENLAGLVQRRSDLVEIAKQFPEDTRQGQLVRQNIADIDAQLQGYTAQTQVFEENPTVDAKDRKSFKVGDEIRKASGETFGVPDPRDTGFWGKVAEGGGNLAGMAAASLATGPAALLTGGAIGSGMNASQVYKEAIEAGADEETAQDAAKWAAGVGASEIIPISRALKILPPRLRGEVTNKLLRKTLDIAQSAGEEAAQEFLAQVANNWIAQGYYDPERGWNEGAGEAALIGGILGGGMGAIGTAFERDNAGETPATRPPSSVEEVFRAWADDIERSQPAGDAAGVAIDRLRTPQPDQPVARPQPPQMAAPTQGIAPVINTQGAPVVTPEEPEEKNAAPTETPVQAPVQTAAPVQQAPVAGQTGQAAPVTQDVTLTPEEEPLVQELTRFTQDLQSAADDDERSFRQGLVDQVTKRLDDLVGAERSLVLQEYVKRAAGVPVEVTDTPLPDAPKSLDEAKAQLASLGDEEVQRRMRDASAAMAAGNGEADPDYRAARMVWTAASQVLRGRIGDDAVTKINIANDDERFNFNAPIQVAITKNQANYLKQIKDLPAKISGNTLMIDDIKAFRGAYAAQRKGGPKLDGRTKNGLATMMANISQAQARAYQKALQTDGATNDQQGSGTRAAQGNQAPQGDGGVGAGRPGPVGRGVETGQRSGVDDDGSRGRAGDTTEVMRRAASAAFEPGGKDKADAQKLFASDPASYYAGRVLKFLAGNNGKDSIERQSLAHELPDKTASQEQVAADAIKMLIDGSYVRKVGKSIELTDKGREVMVGKEGADLRPYAAVDRAAAKLGVKLDKEIAQKEGQSQAPEPVNTGRIQPRGTLAPTFLDMSFSNRNSIFEIAFKDAGYEPDKARLLHADKQIEVLQDLLLKVYGIKVELPTKKIRYKTPIMGREAVKNRRAISDRDAIDQMLDAYRQMQMLAHILGVPSHAVGLKDATGRPLTLNLTEKLPGALGMYEHDPSTGMRRIHLPGRSNSFAHEWGHALDHWLALKLTSGTDMETLDLLSRNILEEGIDPDLTNNQRVARAYIGVLQALFADKAKLAAMTINLEARAAAVDKDGKPTKDALSAQKIIADMKKGKQPPKAVWSRYFETSKLYDEQFHGNGGYFTSAPEMFARAMETYAGVRASQISSLPANFLAKPDWAYTSSEDTRAAMTFPRGTDAEEIFTAFDQLGHEMMRTEIFGAGARANKPEDVAVFDMRQWHHWRDKRNLLKRELSQWENARNHWTKVKRGQSLASATWDAFEYYAATLQGHIRGIVKRQPPEAQKALTNLLDMFMTDPGSGRVIGTVWEEAVENKAKSLMNQLTNISEKFGLDRLSDSQMKELRLLMTGQIKQASDPKLTEAAAHLRRLLDGVWRYVEQSGIKVGYVRNGWLPRIIDRAAVDANPKGFLAQAQQVYELMFEREVMTGDLDTEIKDLGLLVRRVAKIKEPNAEGKPIPRYAFNGDQIDKINEWAAGRKKYRRLERALKKAIEDGDGDKIDAAQAKLTEYVETYFQEIHDDTMEIVKEVFSRVSAEDWKTRVMIGNSMDFDTKGPSNTFVKRRKLPEETDGLMVDFYEGNPITLIQDYLQMAPRRVEYVKRAGLDSERLEGMLIAAERAGAHGADIIKIRNTIQLLTGREVRHDDAAASRIAGWAYVGATVTLLKRAFFSSLAEPITAGIRSGDVRDSLRAVAMFMVQMARTKSAQDRVEVARVIGLITSSEHETIMLNRYGGDIDPNRRQGRTLANFFRYTLLTQLTNMQRASMLATSNAIIQRHLKKSLTGNQRSVEELADLGIPKDKAKDLLDWIESIGGFPNADSMLKTDGDFFNEAAKLWADANSRLVQQIIQNPRRFSRPAAALDSKFRMMYGITGFVYSFHANVLLPIFKKHIDGMKFDDKGNARYGDFAKRFVLGSSRNLLAAAPAMAMLYTGQLLAFMLRTALFNADKFEEMDDDEEMAEWLIEQTFRLDPKDPFGFPQIISRSGLLGPLDIPLNAYTGLKYGTDLAGLRAGPHLKFWADASEDILMLGARNSENTNTAERAALNTVMELAFNTGSGLILSSLPGGPLTTPIYAGAMWGIEALDPAEALTDAIMPSDKKK